MAFDPKKHVIRIQGGREYLPVAARLVWFRGEHPDWGIVTTPVELNMEKQYAIFSCQIFNSEGKLMATATKMENVRGFGDFLEKAETGSVGRALAYCGYGTQFAPEMDEGADRPFVDAPFPQAGSEAAAENMRAAGEQNVAAPTTAAGNRCSCDECPNILTIGQMTMSMKKYGAAFCLLHQKNAPPLIAGGARPSTSSQNGVPRHAYPN